MPDVLEERAGVPVLVCDPAGPPVATTEAALDLIGGAAFGGAEVVAVPAGRLDPSFFALGTRFAGEVMQKFVNYRLRLVVVGDISGHLAGSSALRDFVAEADRGRQLWFVTTADDLDERLRAG